MDTIEATAQTVTGRTLGVAIADLVRGPAAIVDAAPAHDADDGSVVLSTAPPSRGNWRLAGIVIGLSVVVFAALVPFATVPLLEIPAFIPAYQSALVINDLVTAILLFGQFNILRSRALLVLASGYLFTGLIAIVHTLSFPGAFAPHGLLGAGPQTTAWLFVVWHSGFPLVAIAYALRRRGPAARPVAVATRTAVAGAVATAVGAVCALTVAVTVGERLLPPIMAGNHYTPVYIFVLAATWAFSLLAMALLALRRPLAVLDLWLIVVMCAWLGDIALSAVLNAGRFDLGFYAGRLYGLLAASFVLGVLLVETTRLYPRLAGAARRLGDYAGTLETSVRARTLELERSNAALSREANERKQAEAQLVQAQKMEAIGNLTGGMAHDFNNLLGVIIGNLDLLRELRPADPDVDELAREAIEAAVRGADLTRRLLAFARRQPLRPEPVELNGLVSGMVKLLNRVLGEDIDISLDLADDLYPVVVDPAQLEASFTNLATNARDAMPRGGKLMIVTGNRHLDEDYAAAHALVTPGDYAMIEVTDTGTGMTRETVRQIFEPFYTTKEPGKGTGLGLSMVYGFMKQSGGHINVYSELGIGTTFRLYLPRAEAGAVAVTTANDDAMPMGQGESVLVVEDNAGMRRVVNRQLADLNYKAVEVDNAAAALILLESIRFDLLFSDVVLPGALNGLELARTARRRWPDLRVVLTSGFPAKTNGGLEPVGRLLVKPYRKLDLARALREALAS